MVIKRILAVAAVLAVTGCSLDKQTAPPLSGPSELGLSLGVTITPDIITQDGVSQAVIDVTARDANSQPVKGLTLRAEIYVGGVAVDYGVLSSRTASTGNDGKTLFIYRAPAAPPASVTNDTLVTIAVVPVGSNYANAVARTVELRLARPGVILPPNGAPTASFFFSPTSPRETDDVLFDGSASRDADGSIVSYLWTFGDGSVQSGSNPRAFHAYSLAGSYNVVLTVTDDRGLTASSAPVEVKVSSLADPSASLTFSPTAPTVNLPVNFNASGSKAVAGRNIVTYDFDFGDGRPHQVSGSPFAQHAYDLAATFVVTLRVVDDTGRFATTTQSVTVAP